MKLEKTSFIFLGMKRIATPLFSSYW